MVRLLVFTAEWCGPCSQQKDVLSEMDTADVDVEIIDIDSEDGTELANEYSVRSIPSTIVQDDDGSIVNQFIGFTDEDTLQESIAKA